MTVQTFDMSGSDAPAGPSKGTLGFIIFALLCLLPLSSDTFVSLIGKASGVSGLLAYVFAWSASFAMGLLALVAIGVPALVLWHLLADRR
ncbi:hypothetical protein [Azospirillum sp.]|uniref:hypothetical protein n=1 Tax=Azospirillum sp. TaxID=34012 RepID=UPI003D72E6E4